MVVGNGAPSRRAYFAGEQHAFVSRALSACIVFSSFSQSERLPQNLRCSDVRRHDDPIVHPLPSRRAATIPALRR